MKTGKNSTFLFPDLNTPGSRLKRCVNHAGITQKELGKVAGYSPQTINKICRDRVAPCAGAWIEMPLLPSVQSGTAVAPCAGAWIEIILLSWILNRLYAPMWLHGLLWLGVLIRIVEWANEER